MTMNYNLHTTIYLHNLLHFLLHFLLRFITFLLRFLYFIHFLNNPRSITFYHNKIISKYEQHN
jgi:hypothetical protein